MLSTIKEEGRWRRGRRAEEARKEVRKEGGGGEKGEAGKEGGRERKGREEGKRSEERGKGEETRKRKKGVVDKARMLAGGGGGVEGRGGWGKTGIGHRAVV